MSHGRQKTSSQNRRSQSAHFKEQPAPRPFLLPPSGFCTLVNGEQQTLLLLLEGTALDVCVPSYVEPRRAFISTGSWPWLRPCKLLRPFHETCTSGRPRNKQKSET